MFGVWKDVKRGAWSAFHALFDQSPKCAVKNRTVAAGSMRKDSIMGVLSSSTFDAWSKEESSDQTPQAGGSSLAEPPARYQIDFCGCVNQGWLQSRDVEILGVHEMVYTDEHSINWVITVVQAAFKSQQALICLLKQLYDLQSSLLKVQLMRDDASQGL